MSLLRRAVYPSSRATCFVRTFTSSSSCRESGRTPSLGDISHDGAEHFNARQKEFRQGLEAARKKKEQADRQSLKASVSSRSSPSPAAPASPSPGTEEHPDSARILNQLGLGSFSTHHAGEARMAEHESGGKKKGPFSSLIYGTAEGQQMDKDMERSFSQVLARGKYVHSIVFHEVKPDKIDEYVALIGDWYPKVAGMEENKVNLVGSWRTEVGDSDTFGKSSCCNLLGSITNINFKCTFGNINDTLDITPRCITYPATQTFQHSTRNSGH